jgi:hypothetical protein
MSFIKSITLENFKGISSRVTIPLKPLTLLFGANSAGKSTVLQAMLYIREVIRTGEADLDLIMQRGTNIDFGGFKNLLHNHDTKNNTMRIRFEFDYSKADLTKCVEIKEYLYKIETNQRSSIIDLSNIGDEVETGWIEFHLGTGTKEIYAPRVLYWEVGFDGIWFARTGNWMTRNELSMGKIGTGPDMYSRAVLNEVHPLLALPEDEKKTGNLYGEISDEAKTEYYELYFNRDHFTLPEVFQKDELLELLKHYHGETIAEAFNEYTDETFADRDDFIDGTIRAALDPDGNSVIEFGILKEDGGLGLYRCISRGTQRSRYLMKINSIDRCPMLLNMNGCLPDWEKPFMPDWPLSHIRRVIAHETDEKLYLESLAALEFIEKVIERFCIGPLLLLKNELSSLRYIGPIRDIVPRDFKTHKHANEDRWVNGYAAWDALYRDFELYGNLVQETSTCLNRLGLNYSLKQETSFILPMDHQIVSELDLLAMRYEERDSEFVHSKIISQLYTLEKLKKIQIIDKQNGTSVEPDDIGVGVSQVLPVVVGALEKSAPILAVEQPELHVHPAVACNLGDLFIREFVGNNRLCLIETHSEHLVLRLMKRVRETASGELPDDIPEVTPEDVSIVFVENVEGRTIMRSMPLNERGELIKAWPGGFFEEALKETL